MAPLEHSTTVVVVPTEVGSDEDEAWPGPVVDPSPAELELLVLLLVLLLDVLSGLAEHAGPVPMRTIMIVVEAWN